MQSIKTRSIKRSLNIWAVMSFFFIVLIILPNISVLAAVFKRPNENWLHIRKYLLRDYIANSIMLVSFTGLFASVLGTLCAWLVCAYDFPLRKFMKWALMLPLAIPPYIAAYIYGGMLSYTGVIQTFMRNRMGLQPDQKYFDIMSMKGAIFIFTFFLFPYVYIITKSFLERQSSSLIENARLLGKSSLEIFFNVILPVSRASIVAGTSLVAMEVLNDYGVVQYFGIPAFSTAIFKAWFSMGDIDSAIKLSSILMVMVVSVLVGENFMRGRRRYSLNSARAGRIVRKKLRGAHSAMASLACILVFGFGFAVPLMQLAYWGIMTYRDIITGEFISMTMTSLFMAIITSLIIMGIALVMANYCRLSGGRISKVYSRITSIGYSIPAAVISVAMIVFFISVDKSLYALVSGIGIESPKLILSTSIAMLVFAYCVRFLAVGYGSVESGFQKTGKRFHESSRMLGKNSIQTFWQVDLKLIQPALTGGFLLVFVDILKELPLTLILRPFNFNTLAIKAYQYANDEMIHEASIASLIIIGISLAAIYAFNKTGSREAE
ncbi:iron(III) transport system permease protein [Peptoclostridium litorale DSM 5388]|uniref:Fe(3+)-transport system permease protein FbpB 2 n=1 Tax=Peptoclostridium litorale DSM 5388 TaxID=1121324 RepID=A0A069RIZ4_PEPLI|nr:iron ABC transporter permease [Peptoclostridium litorale]KDR96773.1 Fe(3+)-transport system permease protein FbpB 2 [Peptoclostridium litorale DSM 5388]SIO34559.1 iron(III) transport system permease protein [Peptoclostridium litorale DSM 5388]